jgi:CubicO group peptidase (beta-lactamase class C family)
MISRVLVTLAAIPVLTLSACQSPQPVPAHTPRLEQAADFDAVLDAVWAGEAHPPGMAVAVYTPQGVYVRGLGVTDVKTGERVSADTAFYIASTTKAFTALAMNSLAHRGQISLDTTLAQLAPDAAFPTAIHADQVKVRDLLTHTSGIENGPIAFRSAYTGEHTPELMWKLLESSAVNARAPKGKFEYTNTGYNILTIVTDRKLGVRWQDMLQREIFAPAGMTHSTAYMSKAQKDGWSIAKPHASLVAGAADRLDIEKTDGMMQSAGGLIVSANDAARWLELLVNDGQVQGRQVVLPEAVRETRARLAKVGAARGVFTREDYGLGWYVGKYREETVLSHGGGFAGFSSFISYMPERKIGVAVFVNDSGAGSAMPEAVTQHVYDRLIGQPGSDNREAAVAAMKTAFAERIAAVTADVANRAKRPWTLSQPRSVYAGTYESAALGTLIVTAEGEKLSARLGPLHAVAEPYTQQDTIRVAFAGQGMVIGFEVAPDGRIPAANFSGARFQRVN